MFEFYIKHSMFSNPENYSELFLYFPNDIKSLVLSANKLLFHYADQSISGYNIPMVQYEELNYRFIKKTLNAILNKSSAPFFVEREYSQKVLGICRDSALMICSVLRSRGIPARLRAGFNAYYLPTLFLDGFCLEYYDIKFGRWRLVDTRTTQAYIQHFHLKIDFDLTDLTEKHFISAASAWKMCRTGFADPTRFGSRGYYGMDYIRNKVIQDFALLNKFELLIWDLWGDMFGDKKLNNDFIDYLADFLLESAHDVKKITRFYQENPILQVPDTMLVANPFLAEKWERIVC